MEKMDEFFTARVEGYDEHMLNEVGGCREAYEKMAELIPDGTENILDLGCGRIIGTPKTPAYERK